MSNDLILKSLHVAIKACTACDLAWNRTQAVPGIGPVTAPAVLIAEKPGKEEDRKGYPMVGEAGQVFDRALEEVGLSRRDFYITNVIKCYPPYGHTLSVKEVETCEPWLGDQLSIIRPKLVVVCGNVAMARWFPKLRIGEIHGRPRRVQDFIVVPTYHPAFAYHKPELFPVLVEDFRVVKTLLESVR